MPTHNAEGQAKDVVQIPDPFRLRHRTWLIDIIGQILRQPMDKKQAETFIGQQVQSVLPADRERLIEVTETELLRLHEGNFARFRVRPSEFEAWQKQWR